MTTTYPTFVILGHGYENVEIERKILPTGVTLITTTECGRTVQDTNLYKLLDELYKVESAPSPRNLSRKINKYFRIYESGEEYPSLYTSLLLEFPTKVDKNKFIIEKAGVYKLPLSFNPDGEMFTGYIHLTPHGWVDLSGQSIIEKSYEGAVFAPSLDTIKKDYSHNNEIALSVFQESIPISKIFDSLGPGIYYFPLCRQVQIPSQIRPYYMRLKTDIQNKNNIVELLNSIKQEIENEPIAPNNDPEYKKWLFGYIDKKLEKVRKTRATSAKRQRDKGNPPPAGGFRKSRKQKIRK
jgi:hypothetical protein